MEEILSAFHFIGFWFYEKIKLRKFQGKSSPSNFGYSERNDVIYRKLEKRLLPTLEKNGYERKAKRIFVRINQESITYLHFALNKKLNGFGVRYGDIALEEEFIDKRLLKSIRSNTRENHLKPKFWKYDYQYPVRKSDKHDESIIDEIENFLNEFLGMMNNEQLVDLFKKVSINGRLAFGTSCVEQYFDENYISNKWTKSLIDAFWEFTESDRLDLWEEKIGNYRPDFILDKNEKNSYKDYSLLSLTDFEELRNFYSEIPKNGVEMIDKTIEIGVGNLYGATGEFSEFTLKPTLEIYNLAQTILIKPPDAKKFSVSKFSEKHGWGEAIKKEDFN